MIIYKTKESKFARVDGGSDGQSLKKFSTSITGDGVKTAFTIEHNLDTEDIIFEMYDGTEPALIDYAVIDKNNVNITFAIAPTTEQSYSIKIYGVMDGDNNSSGGGSSDTTEVGIVNNDWNYTLDESAGTITLNYYTGNAENVKVYSSYISDNGKTYQTRLASNTDNKFSEYMFAGNTTVKSITFSDNLDASACTDMRNMFYRCTSLTNISLKNFNSTNVTNMCNMFYGCTSLTNLDLSNFNTSNVTHMSAMFSGCTSLTSLDLSSFNTSNTIYMSQMFCNCKSLTNLNISNFDTSNVKSMEDMFDSCMVLENIDVSHFNTRNVTSMKNMFAICYKLSSLELSNFDTSQATIMYGMFMGCNSMGTLDLTSFDTKKVTNMDMMFNGCCSDYVYVTTGKWVMSQASQDHMFGSGGVSELTYV